MLTLRATINEGKVEFVDKIELKGEHKVLITLLETDITSFLFPEPDHELVMKAVSKYQNKLSNREIEVLQLMQQGLTNEEIGDKLEIGHGTVRNYTSSIYEKLGVANRTGAIVKAIENGLLS